MSEHETGAGGVGNNHWKPLFVQFAIVGVGFDDLITQVFGILHLPFHEKAAAAASAFHVVMAELVQAVQDLDDTVHRLSLKQIHLTWNIQEHCLLRV